jgi:hypothetical protein
VGFGEERRGGEEKGGEVRYICNGNDSNEDVLVCSNDFKQNLTIVSKMTIARLDWGFDTLYYVILSKWEGNQFNVEAESDTRFDD